MTLASFSLGITVIRAKFSLYMSNSPLWKSSNRFNKPVLIVSQNLW
uniref:Uncharacterized protein n=1 Tax=Arundo donax TaxID=35708 RepID=A0A0A9CFK2_ARUDO